MKTTAIIIGMVIAGILLTTAVVGGIEKQEVIDCTTWKKQATEYTGFYLLGWQDEMCKAHNIEIYTTVIKN